MLDFESISVVEYNVEVKERDGWFVATSKEFPELYLIHQDRDFLIDSVSDAVKGALRLDLGPNAEVIDINDSSCLDQPAEDAVNSPWILGIINHRVEAGVPA